MSPPLPNFGEDDRPFMPVAFQFRVGIGDPPQGRDVSFQEVTGLELKMETEDVRSGGENRFVFKLPKGVTQDRITLKRGIAGIDSPLTQWCKSVLEGGMSVPIKPSTLRITLLDAKHAPARSWSLLNAYPVGWSVDTLNSTRNEVVIESIELAYLNCTRED